MKDTKRQVEILAPAGSMESLKAAINAGCDAVYMGGSRFGARAYADNPNDDEMLEAIDYAHFFGKKLYLTVNTLLKETEMSQLKDYLAPLYERGLDAVIVQDIGVMKRIHTLFPKMEIHASTQMTLTQAIGANELKKYGVTRLVPARELSLAEIVAIREQTELELECFVHGALCYCYSGQCLMSSMQGGRSGNRGRCAQPCRRRYSLDGSKTEYLLSPKDICTLELIPDLIEGGINSFKIEGRMKRPEYAALTASLYRKYADLYLELGREGYKAYLHNHAGEFEKDKMHLMDIYNRGNFTTGYYAQYHGKEMMSMLRPNHNGVYVGKVVGSSARQMEVLYENEVKAQDVVEVRAQDGNVIYEYTLGKDIKKGARVLANYTKGLKITPGMQIYRTRNASLLEELTEHYLHQQKKLCVHAHLYALLHKPLGLTLTYCDASGEHRVTLVGEEVSEAQKQPMTKERLQEVLYKNGEDKYITEDVTVEMDDNIFVSVGALKKLRREAFLELTEEILKGYRRTLFCVPEEAAKCKVVQRERITPQLRILVDNYEQLITASKAKFCRRIYVPETVLDKKVYEQVKAIRPDIELFIAMPYIFRKKEMERLEQKEGDLSFADGFLIRNYEELAYVLKKYPTKRMIGDCNMYTYNREAERAFLENGMEEFTCGVELTKNELQNITSLQHELIIYGNQLLMVSAQCLLDNTTGCTKQKRVHALRGEKGKEMFVVNECTYCYNLIYDAVPSWLAEEPEEILELGVGAFRLNFKTEEKAKMEAVIGKVETMLQKNADTGLVKESLRLGFATNRGHFDLGVQ
ncbi:MAG: U32 family peptidase [Lachnospiraceae bacterium]|nr:U32 family peptidase [Lachnospiraceae bacterium]